MNNQIYYILNDVSEHLNIPQMKKLQRANVQERSYTYYAHGQVQIVSDYVLINWSCPPLI